jgi:tetratricopeptide (TPR) repeat protein
LPNKDGAQSPELVKLADKFRKDPSSKLFFPLAEEYAKVGRIGEAIELLRTGIKAHPDLLSARVSLGKALLAKGLHAEAQAEFEQVIVANPDNIMAHKKLASIYVHAGDKPRAVASCQAVLAVNPSDVEVLKLREEADRLAEIPPAPPRPAFGELSEGFESEPTVVDPTLVDVVEPTVVDPTLVDVVEPTVVDPTLMSRAPGPAPVEAAIGQAEEDAPSAAVEEGPIEDDLATVSMADLFVAQGHYQRGIEIYRRILDRNPGHVEATAKLDNALTLDRLLSPQRGGGEALRTDVVRSVLGGVGEARREPAAAADRSEPVAEPIAALVGVSKHAATIRRLEAWLSRIAERRRA